MAIVAALGAVAILAVLEQAGDGLAVLAPIAALVAGLLIVVVQQIEGNVLQPLLMGKVTRLSAFTVIVAVSIGTTVLGVLGALIAVPAAACLSQALAFARERAPHETS